MNQKRPVNLDLGSIKFPPMAIASILHRISGLVLFLFLPIMLCFLKQSLVSEVSYQHLNQQIANCVLYKFVIWGFSTALLYHVLAGARHLLMDTGMGETLDAARRSAWIVIGLSILGAMTMGACLWSAV